MNDLLAKSGLVIVDKPEGMTSHDVVGKLRRIFGTRKIGHAGTLDPLATGVLVLGVERGTKFLSHMTAATKAYTATIRLGVRTDTDDCEGNIIEKIDARAAHLSDHDIVHATQSFVGDIMQRPAAVSAIKVAGKRAYQLVREGQKVELAPRPIRITAFDVLARRDGDDYIDLDVAVECSSGTYIRSLARDLGEKLEVGGSIIALRRTAVGAFTLADARTLEELSAHASLSLTLDHALQRCYPIMRVTPQEAHDLSMGKWLEPRGLHGVHAAVDENGHSIALVKENKTRLATVFVARPSTL
ncbi:tRNA pseudouridine(55) synthase TruB [Corynebacterium sp. sy017]|uniref:tRNA pseudouridine(55) synthase TruB n=1 Tax=unclassified Corynebacterium TaxID=2624378 RepID=UPI001184A550|nr:MULTISPECIES: tRNA pseudouridine(55) synthase TruB [unclassified Corynebacterium]MBP3087821.1 tRNA pseudouridine(55) synthase TruB [Corynebacterium sp. sy017]TSD92366.1 tRNA pseudouridine(55) synthase TruB [Corynebacterium sp. SY003]